MFYVYDQWYSDPLTREFVVVRHAQLPRIDNVMH